MSDRSLSRKYFAERIAKYNPKNPIVKQVAEHVTANLSAWENIGATIERASKRPANWNYLTPEGQKATMKAARQEALADSFKTNARSKAALKKLRATLNSTVPKFPDRQPGDMVGELRDQEARALVRAMSPEQR